LYEEKGGKKVHEALGSLLGVSETLMNLAEVVDDGHGAFHTKFNFFLHLNLIRQFIEADGLFEDKSHRFVLQ
jgi:hypothetical protein